MKDNVVASQEALLQLYSRQINDSLEMARLDMSQRITDDLSLNTLSIYDPDEDRYKLNIQACKQWLGKSVSSNKLTDAVFIYAKNSMTLITASRIQDGLRYRYIANNIENILEYESSVSSPQWDIYLTDRYVADRDSPAWVLLKCVPASQYVSIGSFVLISDFIPPLQKVVQYEGQITLVFSGEGNLLSPSSMPEGITEDIVAAMLNENLPAWIRIDALRENYIAICCSLEAVNARIYTLIPEGEVLSHLSAISATGIYLPVFLLAIAIFTAYFIRRSLYRPFQSLMSAMEKVSGGDLTIRLPIGNNTEFQLVNAQFNDMVQRIEGLNKDVQKQTVRAYKAEIRHLQSQINPHFYQNTLNLIYNLAALREIELIKKTTLYLAEYFRFIMRSGDQMIDLRDELTHISNYMELQKIRHPNIIEYNQDVGEGLGTYKILPLIIQPFIENCIIHGFTQRYKFIVSLHIARYPDKIEISINDNGNGMELSMISRLNALMDEPDDHQSEHIGIWNVVARIKKYYGEDARLMFAQQESAGASVHIELPDKKRGVDDDQFNDH